MSKRVNAKYKVSRSLSVNLWGRGKDPFVTKNYGPGEHGPQRRRILSDYAKQLRAKQQLRKYYANITEKQFRGIYKEAVRRKGDTGLNLVQLLESRLDTVVYRANFVPTMYAARQLVSHKHVTVNGVKVNVPSYRLKVGDVVELREKSRAITMVVATQQEKEREVPEYIQSEDSGFKVSLARLPALEEIPYPCVMEPNLVIEFYSR